MKSLSPTAFFSILLFMGCSTIPKSLIEMPPPPEVRFKAGIPVTPEMIETRASLETLLKTHDLDEYSFSRIIEIDPGAIPHSHPILTLDIRERRKPEQLLATLLHEQLEWHLRDCEKQTEQAISYFQKMYSGIPVGFPQGAEDERSNYLQLANIWLEYQALKRFLGPDAAVRVFESKDYYRWIYRKVLDDDRRIGVVMYGLQLNIEPDPERVNF